MIAAPGSTLWLLRHEVRLFWRGLAQKRGGGRWRRLWLTIAVPLILMASAGVPLGFVLRKIDEAPITPAAGLIAAAVLLSLFTLMLSQTLGAAVTALYERADLDLLFSSPLEPRRVLAVPFLAV